MARKVTKAIFPVAGLGTRFLPATKSVPKEIMTLVDRPLVQYAIDEARAAGITEFIFVTSRGKSALEDYFDHNLVLEQELKSKGKDELLETLNATNMESGAIAYIRQHKALGLGHAVWCARRLIGDEPFAVMLPDDVIAADKPCLQQMIEAYEETGGNMVATMEVPANQTSSYGVLDVGENVGTVVRAKRHGRKAEARGSAIQSCRNWALRAWPFCSLQSQPREKRQRRRNPTDRRDRRGYLQRCACFWLQV